MQGSVALPLLDLVSASSGGRVLASRSAYYTVCSLLQTALFSVLGLGAADDDGADDGEGEDQDKGAEQATGDEAARPRVAHAPPPRRRCYNKIILESHH